MKVNSPASLETAKKVFETYGNSWQRVREAAQGKRDARGFLIVPATPPAQSAKRSPSRTKTRAG